MTSFSGEYVKGNTITMFEEQKTTQQLLIICTMLLFLVFGAEAFLGHSFLLDTRRWVIYLPLVFSFLAAMVSLLVLLRPLGKVMALFKVTMAASILVALAGFYFHGGFETLGKMSLTPEAAPLSYLIPGAIGLAATRKKSLGAEK